MSGAFSGLIAAGILNGLENARGISAWRWLFILEGVITVWVQFDLFTASALTGSQGFGHRGTIRLAQSAEDHLMANRGRKTTCLVAVR